MASKPIHQNDSPHLLFSSLTRPSPNPSESASQSTGSVSRIPHGLLIVLYQSNFHQFSLRAPSQSHAPVFWQINCQRFICRLSPQMII